MDPLKAKFTEEAADLIAELESALLELEDNPQNLTQIEQCFRVMHTLKGTSSMFGYEKIGSLTHDLETIYDFCREGKASINREIIDITFESVDHFKKLLMNEEKLEDNDLQKHDEVLNKIQLILALLHGNPQENVPQPLAPIEAKSPTLCTYYIVFRPNESVLKTGTNLLFLLEDLHALGNCKMTPHIKNIPDFDHLQPENSYIYWDIYLATVEPEQAIRDIFMFVEDDCKLEIHNVFEGDLLNDPKFLEKIDGLEDEISVKELKEIVSNFFKLINKNIPGDRQEKKKELNSQSLRVSTEKLDYLMNLVSELITTQASLSLFAEKYENPELTSIAENIEKISRLLRDNAFSICLIPIESLLTRFKRLVRDLSSELKKDIDFIIEGQDTELDKNIIESLADPLLHILRNSLDHGIESPEERIKAGKKGKGTIIFKAFYSGNYVNIQVKDDGAGINPEKVRAKAIQKQIITEDAVLTDKEALNLVFLPGFSTSDHVTGVSGRGVGMDVVKRKISEIRGEIEMDSVVNEGTTITIKLPLTLSIIDGLLVRIADTRFIIPLPVVQKCYEANYLELENKFDDLLILDSHQVPFLNLRKEFEMGGEKPNLAQVVVVGFSDKKIGLIIDEIIGEYQAVLKPLGKLYQNLDIFSGATILGDGTIALVFDPQKLIQQCTTKQYSFL